jgi:hypothetical protein
MCSIGDTSALELFARKCPIYRDGVSGIESSELISHGLKDGDFDEWTISLSEMVGVLLG